MVPATSFGLFEVLAMLFGLIFFFLIQDLSFILLLVWCKLLLRKPFPDKPSDVSQRSVCQYCFFVISLKIRDTWQSLVLTPENAVVVQELCAALHFSPANMLSYFLQSLFTNSSLVPGLSFPHPALYISKSGENNFLSPPVRTAESPGPFCQISQPLPNLHVEMVQISKKEEAGVEKPLKTQQFLP